MRVHERYQQFQEDQRQFFNELITEEWDTYFSEEWDTVRRHEVARLFAEVQPASVIDMGCGCGFHDQAMAEYPFVRSIHAIDYSQESIKRAALAYPHPKVKRWCADFQRDEMEGAYDLVASFQVIEHLEHPQEYFGAAKRLCRPGGNVAVITPNRHRLSNMLLRLHGKRPILCDPQHHREYTLSDLKKMGVACGLLPEASFGYNLAGLNWIDRQPIERRLRWGGRFPIIALGICVVFRHLP